MRHARTTSTTAARRLLAVALGLWLSGAGCLVCCERAGADARAGDAHHLLAAIREAERAEMSSGHSCCKARVGSGARASAKETAGDATRASRDEASEERAPAGRDARRETVPGRECCRRVLRTAERARWARLAPAQAHAHALTSPAQTSPAAAARAQVFVNARTRAPDRGGTYLACRALLI